MKISLEWLGDYVTWIEKDPLKIADMLTLRSAEVEGVERQGALLGDCCVGDVVKVMPHPNASKLQLADVKTDKGLKRVVCGGTNLKEGMQVAFAHVGATVQHGKELMTLSEATIRGEKSEGMLCAAEELGLEEMFPPKPEDGERPIIDLSRDATGLKTGTDLRTALGLTDVVLDINNTAITNRPDLFSHIGFARECVALGLASWKKEAKKPAIEYPKKAPSFALKTPAKKTLSWYAGVAFDIDSIGETPDWMKRRLQGVGIRCISLPVDITNYVMMEMGSPLHSFDSDDIRGDVTLRVTGENESITTLDNVKRVLPQGTIILSDDDGIFDIVGMMGGERSSTTEKTKHVFLQCPVPDSVLIRKTITAIGLRSDAATIFEKGVPSVSAKKGFERAVELFLSLVPGATLTSSVISFGVEVKAPLIPLHSERVDGILGVTIPAATIVKRLESVGCDVKKKGKDFAVRPPLWRLKDLSIEQDLIEEVARIGGYEAIADAMPVAPADLLPRDARTAHIRHLLRVEGCFEILPLTLLGESLLKKAGMDSGSCKRLLSPLSEELSLLQPSTLPGLLSHAEQSLINVDHELRTFRIATVFSKNEEHRELGILFSRRSPANLLSEPSLSLRDTVQGLLTSLGYSVEIRQKNADSAWMHPGRTATIVIDDADGLKTDIGTIAEIHPDVASRFGLEHRAAAALIDWTLLLSRSTKISEKTNVPAFPAIIYDITVARAHSDAVGPLLGGLRSSHPLLESVQVQDLYQNPREETYRLTLRFTYRAADRTLTEEEAKQAHSELLAKAKLQPIG